jgi:hypothetical protein
MSDTRESLSDLNDAEQSLLARLIYLLVRADREFSAAEHTFIEELDGKIDGGIWSTLEEATSTEDDADAVMKMAESITSQEARELIYGTLYELSLVDSISSGENDLLERLALGWKLSIHDVGDDDDGAKNGPLR